MSATERMRQLLREKPRMVSELAKLVYGTAYGTARSQVHNRLRGMVANGVVEAVRTGKASNAPVLYRWVGQPQQTTETPVKLIQELEGHIASLAQTAAQLRQALEAREVG